MHSTIKVLAAIGVAALTACNKPAPSTDSTAGSASASSASQPLTAGSGEHDRGRPMPGGGGMTEMFDACSGKAAGAACTFKMHDRDVTGTCATGPGGSDGRLACRPEGGPGGPHGGPPPGASH